MLKNDKFTNYNHSRWWYVLLLWDRTEIANMTRPLNKLRMCALTPSVEVTVQIKNESLKFDKFDSRCKNISYCCPVTSVWVLTTQRHLRSDTQVKSYHTKKSISLNISHFKTQECLYKCHHHYAPHWFSPGQGCFHLVLNSTLSFN